MKQWLAPLGVFAMGQILVLFLTLFLPAIDAAKDILNSETVAISGFAWGWTWLMSQGVVRFIIYFIVEALILWATAKAFLASHD